MKKNIFIKAGILLILPVIFYILLSGFKESKESNVNIINNADVRQVSPDPEPWTFTNFIYNMGYYARAYQQTDTAYRFSVEYQIDKYKDSLNFNGIHIYSGANTQNGGASWGGGFEEDLEDYQSYVNSLITTVNGAGLKGIYGRAKIEMLCQAQSVDYEIGSTGSTTGNYGFCYQNQMSNTYTTDSGRTVLHASTNPTNPNSPGWLCKNIYENIQHSDNFSWQWDDRGTWHLKPMMRIKQSDFNSSDTTPVVKIRAINYQGDTIFNKIIRVKHFGNSEGNYSGQYKNEFYFGEQQPDSLFISGDTCANCLNHGRSYNSFDWENGCHVDFRIYWYGNVDVWFDKLTVRDNYAEVLLNSDPAIRQVYSDKITDEVDAFHSGTYAFFTDEMTYSNLPCVKYVRDIIKNAQPDARFVLCESNWLNVFGTRSDTIYFKALMDIVNPDIFSCDAHEVQGPLPVAFSSTSCIPDKWKSSTYTHYNDFVQKRMLGDRTSRTDESSWTEEHFDWPSPLGSHIYQTCISKRYANSVNPRCTLIVQPQLAANMIKDGNTCLYDWEREPTNEEIQVQTMVSIAHGADGLSWYEYQSQSFGGYPSDIDVYRNADNPWAPHLDSFMFIGMLNLNHSTPRHANMWGQDKWNYVAAMNKKVNIFEPVLNSTSWQSGWSVHTEGAGHKYISEIKSIFRDGTSPYSFNSSNEDGTKYWEMGFFAPDYDGNFTEYFMMVNRRCVPETSPGVGDLRQLKVQFDGSNLNNFQNWQVKDVETGQVVCKFARSSTLFYDFGTFQPGEGKLYEIAPVVVKGGELVTDERISSGTTCKCLDTVWTDGYNFRIDGHTSTITFLDSGTIIMDGGTFISDTAIYSSGKNLFKAETAHTWPGLKFYGTNVKIYNAAFQDISSPAGGNFAVSTVDCPLNDIRFNTFTSSTDTAGGISINYLNETDNANYTYIMYNNFTMNNSRSRAIQVQGYAGMTAGTYIRGNNMTSNGYATGIFLSTITDAAIEINTITRFSTGINMFLTSADIYGNNISNSSLTSKGIYGVSSSVINMQPTSQNTWYGGNNIVSNTAGGSRNIEFVNSIFFVADGYNFFDIYSGDTITYHFKGSFWSAGISQNIINNCFKLDGTVIDGPDEPKLNAKDYYNDPLYFNMFPYKCDGTLPEDIYVSDIGNTNFDSIPSSSNGGGLSSKIIVATPRILYDSIRVQLRHRNYTSAKNICRELIDEYTDSSESIASLQTLYLASTAGDTSSATATSLKNYYDNLILNHHDNHALVNISNYLVQKCKVLLHQYSSAMAGFQEIINNNPYSYEGLLARWDYMATSLLLQGHGGGESSITNDDENDFDIGDDKSPFTKEQRQVIRQSVSDVIQNGRILEEQKIIKLIEGAKEGNENADRELKQKMVLKEVVKTEHPRNRIEHLNIVNGDIQKVFGSKVGNSGKTGPNIPHEFSLSQNYPNPFNPITKIKYELPKDIKVVIKVYDILGREVITLVNEFKKAGYYENDFNGSNIASGVYFYRLEAGDFVRAKKMVLVK